MHRRGSTQLLEPLRGGLLKALLLDVYGQAGRPEAHAAAAASAESTLKTQVVEGAGGGGGRGGGPGGEGD